MALTVCAAALAGGSTGCGGGEPSPVTLAVAASLRPAMPDLIRAFGAEPGAPEVRVSYGGSGLLRRQVEGGAPIDVVLLASPEEVDRLVAQGLADPGTRRVIARNELVLVGPLDGPPLRFDTLASLPRDARVAVGDPAFVPAGRYARRHLEALGQWRALEDRLVLAADVTAALALVRRGEVAAACVYATDARGIDDVRVLDRARGPGAPRPELVAAALASPNPSARRFLDFVASSEGRVILARHGFAPPDPS